KPVDRARCGRADETDCRSSATSQAVAARYRALVRRHHFNARLFDLCVCDQLRGSASGDFHALIVPCGLHAVEAALVVVNICRGISRCNAPSHWLCLCDREIYLGRVHSLCDSFSLADAALLLHWLALPRG